MKSLLSLIRNRGRNSLVIPLLLVVFSLVLLLYIGQDAMVYHKTAYADTYKILIPPGAEQLNYVTSEGKQVAWYVPPKTPIGARHIPPRLWLLFSGNASLALFWNDTVENLSDDSAGVLLFDYPGYGLCEGKPTPSSIAESSDAALVALLHHLKSTQSEIESHSLCVMGHSLGAGVALDFATRHTIDRAVLLAPFTSLQAMANRSVTPLLGWLLKYKMDNVAALRKLNLQIPPASVIIIHGSDDNIIPVEMGRALKNAAPDIVRFIEIPGGGHDSIVQGVENYMDAKSTN